MEAFEKRLDAFLASEVENYASTVTRLEIAVVLLKKSHEFAGWALKDDQ